MPTASINYHCLINGVTRHGGPPAPLRYPGTVGRGTPVTPEEDAEIERLRAEGKGLGHIGKITGRPQSTIRYRLCRLAALADAEAS